MSMSITSSRAGDAAARNGDASARARRSTSVGDLGASSSGDSGARRFASSAACRKNARNRYQPLFVVSREGWRVMTSVRREATRGGHDPRGGHQELGHPPRPRSRAAAAAAVAAAAAGCCPPAPPTAGGRWPAPRLPGRPSARTASCPRSQPGRGRSDRRSSRRLARWTRPIAAPRAVSVSVFRSTARARRRASRRRRLSSRARVSWLADAPRASPRSPRAPSPRVVS